MEIPRPLAGFLRRTFDNPPILHHLTPLCRYFHGKGRLGNSGRMYAHFHKGQVDIISFSRSTVALANSYRYRDPMDAIYYIMACRNMAGLDPMADELFLCGDTAVREETTPQLREYLAYVMPVIFPSAVFKTGKTHFQHLFTLQYSHYANNPRKIRTSALRRPHKHISARPTTDFARENIFNVMENIVDFEDAEALDLFAGTGAITFEFLSRGCKTVTSVEKAATQYNFIRKVAQQLNATDSLRLIRGDALRYIPSATAQYDVIFADPHTTFPVSGRYRR